MADDKMTSVLNNLVEVCKDGEEGFRTAAEGLENATIKSKFLDYSQERGRMATELQEEVRRMGGTPEKSGSVAASAHRGWMNIRSVVSGNDDHAIVAEAERGEDHAKSAYDEALRAPLPASAQTIVERQAQQVRQAHDDVRALRDRDA